ncbi:MAG: sigma-70 family RNA polymerase sigma factor [Dehalococcoidales bacterium]
MSATKEAVSAEETFAELYEEYMPKVFRYIQYRVNNMQLTEDLTSTTFEKALVSFSKYSSDRAKFSTWIFSIARNVVIDHYRLKGRRMTLPLEEASEVASRNLPPEEELLKREELERLQICLTGLSEEEQEIIRLKFGAELNNRQIAKMLGLSESNIGTRLYRAVRKLRDSFQESENG